MKKLLALTALIGLCTSLPGATVLFEDDFSSLPLGVDLTNASWWYNCFNTGDVAYTQANTDGPDGAIAVTVYYQVFGGRWYGGLLRHPGADIPSVAGIDPANVHISFWLKGTSSTSRGGVGFSMLSFAGSANTGAAYKLIPVVPGVWTEFTMTLAEMRAGIPGHATDGKPFNLETATRLQVILWSRSPETQEPGWPTAENENLTYSFRLANVSITADAGGGNTWAGYDIVDGWVDTGAFLGLLYVAHDPWIYCYDAAQYIYLPESHVQAGGAWSYFFN